jgi:hypothetical protein
MWTTIRAVELKTFKSFDDGVSIVQLSKDRLLVGMTNELINYSVESRLVKRVTHYTELILTCFMVSPSLYVATKSSNMLLVYVTLEDTISESLPKSYDLSSSRSAFFYHRATQMIWFGLTDGRIINFSVATESFKLLVIYELGDFLEF